MKKFRRILFILTLFSLLLVPYSFLAYVCYLGLCGGGEAKAISLKYTSFYGYFCWVYFLTVLLSVVFSLIFRNKIKLSTFFLLFPVMGMLILMYVEFKVSQIKSNYQAGIKKSHEPNSNDFICGPGKYIRIKNKNLYYFYNYNADGITGSINAFYSYDSLQKELKSKSLDINKCINSNNKKIT